MPAIKFYNIKAESCMQNMKIITFQIFGTSETNQSCLILKLPAAFLGYFLGGMPSYFVLWLTKKVY